jgi:hypothetical protein
LAEIQDEVHYYLLQILRDPDKPEMNIDPPCGGNIEDLWYRFTLSFLSKYFRHQDTKTRSLIIKNIYCLCLGAWWLFFPACPGWVGVQCYLPKD